MDSAQRTHLEHLLQIHRAHLRELELQAAKWGDLNVPSHIALQIAEYHQKIAGLEEQVREALPHHNLPPRDYERFVGRQRELEEVRRLLRPYPKSRAYVITIDGIGGIGKSALALETAYSYREGYATLPEAERFEAIVWVSAKRTYLTADGILERRQVFRTLDDLYTAIAQVLDYPAITRAPAAEQRAIVEQALGEQRTLLILDNLETVDDEELMVFLRELPDPAKAIVTTRHRIDVAHPVRLTGMPHTDALALIDQEAARKDVTLAPEEREELWARTGGMPLAIVWSIGLIGLGGSVTSVLRRLGQGQSDIARFCFEESVAQIRGRDAHTLLLTLALFEASVSRKMLGEVAGLGEDEFGRDIGLEDLLRLSLVNKETDRFSLLALTRNYALDDLARQPEREHSLRERQIEHLTTLAATYLGPRWRWRNRPLLLQEGVHLEALANWCQRMGRHDVLLRTLPGLIRYYDLLGRWSDALNISRVGLEHARLVGDLASIVWIQIFPVTWVLRGRKQYVQAEESITEAITTARQLEDITQLSDALVEYSRLLRAMGELGRSLECCQQAFLRISEVPDEYRPYVQANIELEFGRLARAQGNWQAAQQHFVNIREMFSQNDKDPIFLSEFSWVVLRQLGILAQQRGDLVEAAHFYRQAIDLCQTAETRVHSVNPLVLLAKVEEQLSNWEAARTYARQALVLSREFGWKREQAEAEALLERLKEAP